MANVEEDLVTDSVPDAPRSHPSPDGSGLDGSSNNESADEAEVADEKPQQSRKASTSEEKQRRHSSSKSRRSFGIPNISSPGGASMICINNASNVHVGNSININFVGQAYSQSHTSKSPSPEPRNSQKPKDVKDACKNREHVSVEDLDTVAEHIGKRWMKLGERLGYTAEQMERFQEDHNHIGLKEVVYQMLLDWKQYKGPQAQVGILCHCLWSSHLYTAAKQLAALHSGKAP